MKKPKAKPSKAYEVVRPHGVFSVGHIIPDLPPNRARMLEGMGLVRPAPADRMQREKVTK